MRPIILGLILCNGVVLSNKPPKPAPKQNTQKNDEVCTEFKIYRHIECGDVTYPELVRTVLSPSCSAKNPQMPTTQSIEPRPATTPRVLSSFGNDSSRFVLGSNTPEEVSEDLLRLARKVETKPTTQEMACAKAMAELSLHAKK